MFLVKVDVVSSKKKISELDDENYINQGDDDKVVLLSVSSFYHFWKCSENYFVFLFGLCLVSTIPNIQLKNGYIFSVFLTTNNYVRTRADDRQFYTSLFSS